MTDPITRTWRQAADLLHLYGGSVLLAAGIALALLVVFLGWRWFRRGAAHHRTGNLAVALATAVAAEGMWEVFTESLGLPIPTAIALFAMFEVVMVNQALTAKYKLSLTPPKDPSRHMNFVWALAAGSGVIACANSTGPAEFLLRLAAPSIAAGIWWTGITVDVRNRVHTPSSWRWTPRRLLLWMGAIEPGERDAVKVDRDRRIAQIAATSFQVHVGGKGAKEVEAKLQRLMLDADPEMIAAARTKAQQAADARRLVVPTATVDGGVDSATRELCDGIRVQARVARSRVSTPAVRWMPWPAIDAANLAVSARPNPGHEGGQIPASEPASARPNGGQIPATDAANVRPNSGHEAATAPAKTADTLAATRGQTSASKPATDAATKPANQRPAARPEMATRVAKLAAKDPDITAAQVASKLKISDRTARRYLAEVRPANGRESATDSDDPEHAPVAAVNGHDRSDLIGAIQ